MMIVIGYPWVTHALNFFFIMLMFNVINLGMAQVFCYAGGVEPCEHSVKGSLLTFTRNVDYSWGLAVGFMYAWFYHCDVHEKIID
jgi:hypothetical protein